MMTRVHDSLRLALVLLLLILVDHSEAFSHLAPRKIQIISPTIQPSLLRSAQASPCFFQSSCRLASTTNDEGDIDSEDLNRWTPLTIPEKLLLPFQLVLSIYLLLLLPSGLATGSLCGARALSTLPYEYLTFFSLLVIPRAFRFGKFAKVVPKSTPKRSTSIQSVLLFILSLIGSHWFASYQFAASSADFWAPEICLAVRLLACALVGWSGWELGKSYDRVATPDDLITSGPYRLVRHPIYTAYLLLFSSTLLTLRAQGACAAMLGVSLYFYNGRMQSEEELLEDCFGEDYVAYKQNVKWRLIPFL